MSDTRLRVPRDSRLVIYHGGGNILIDNVTGAIDATNREGDIAVMLPGPGPYAIDARSKMGTVISDFAGKAHVRYFIGEALSGANANRRPSDPSARWFRWYHDKRDGARSYTLGAAEERRKTK